ncbi:MAG: lipoyl(octanoyl) transferase LipB [Planctomycetota bacterium]|nr:lipoyl(octanoyl) transferase LipB [Planctomycetota bacterium]MDP6954786.1 lipoyl(octanoyl) transferase LipB [Planctomycetota bacterium]
METTPTALEVRRLGRLDFATAHALQEELVERRAAGEITDQLLLVEHNPVWTVGRGGDQSNAEMVVVARGGEATYHGPGQLVAYPIMLLPEGRRDLKRYLRDLEEVVIGVLGEFGVEGARRPGLTGVWIAESKVCSIGIAVRRWVTWHGLALNVHTDLAAFAEHSPCGLDANVMTRLDEHASLPPGLPLIEVLLVKHMCRVFACQPRQSSAPMA